MTHEEEYAAFLEQAKKLLAKCPNGPEFDFDKALEDCGGAEKFFAEVGAAKKFLGV